ncbi:hypothetical protein K439DRAFT_1511076 [Ramaria rubella]|nr:hypothetical protein K439DRAFT_1511076 [Ramaria rubella]
MVVGPWQHGGGVGAWCSSSMIGVVVGAVATCKVAAWCGSGMAVGGDGGRLEVNGGGAARIGWRQGPHGWGWPRGCGGWRQGPRWMMAMGCAGVVAGGKRAAAGSSSGGVVVVAVMGCACGCRWRRGWQVGLRGWGWRRIRWVAAGTAVENGGGGASAGVVAGGSGCECRCGGRWRRWRRVHCGGDAVVGVLVVVVVVVWRGQCL